MRSTTKPASWPGPACAPTIPRARRPAGDPSDNLMGVRGIGEKMAAKLVNQYGSLDALFADLVAAPAISARNLAAYEENVRRNAEIIPRSVTCRLMWPSTTCMSEDGMPKGPRRCSPSSNSGRCGLGCWRSWTKEPSATARGSGDQWQARRRNVGTGGVAAPLVGIALDGCRPQARPIGRPSPPGSTRSPPRRHGLPSQRWLRRPDRPRATSCWRPPGPATPAVHRSVRCHWRPRSPSRQSRRRRPRRPTVGEAGSSIWRRPTMLTMVQAPAPAPAPGSVGGWVIPDRRRPPPGVRTGRGGCDRPRCQRAHALVASARRRHPPTGSRHGRGRLPPRPVDRQLPAGRPRRNGSSECRQMARPPKPARPSSRRRSGGR